MGRTLGGRLVSRNVTSCAAPAQVASARAVYAVKSACKASAAYLYLFFHRQRRYRSSMVEHRFCKPGVVGSTPTGSLVECGQVAERPMASDCKSDGLNLRGFESLPAHKVVDSEW